MPFGIAEKPGRVAALCVLAVCRIGAQGAVIGDGWEISSNAGLQIQWYRFGSCPPAGADQGSIGASRQAGQTSIPPPR